MKYSKSILKYSESNPKYSESNARDWLKVKKLYGFKTIHSLELSRKIG